jgi:hypothetical protein
LTHHGFIKILIEEELYHEGRTWDQFIMEHIEYMNEEAIKQRIDAIEELEED